MNIMLAYVLRNAAGIAALGCEFLAVLFCAGGIFRKGLKINWTVIALLLIDIIVFSAIREGALPEYFTGVTYMMAFLYCLTEYKRNILETAKNFILSIAVAGIFEILASILLFPIRGILKQSEQTALSVNFISLLFAVLFSRLMIQKKFTYQYGERKRVITTIVSGFCMSYLLFDYRYRGELDQIYYLIFMGLIIMLYLYREKMQRTHFELEKREVELKLQEIYGDAYEELLYEVRRKQHDFTNQIGAICSMHLTAVSLEDLIEKQRAYGSVLMEQCRYDKILTGCNHPILAGYLYYKCVNYEKNNVFVDYKIHVDTAECGLSLYELIEVLGIFLTNAYESADEETNGQKVIKLVIEENAKNLMVEVSNRSEYLTCQDIENIFHKDYSSKGKNRGIGLSRVKELAKKSGADIIVENCEKSKKNWITFKMIISK